MKNHPHTDIPPRALTRSLQDFWHLSLSFRFFALTCVFMMLSTCFALFPILANFRSNALQDRASEAYHVYELLSKLDQETPEREAVEKFEFESIEAQGDVLSISISRPEARYLVYRAANADTFTRDLSFNTNIFGAMYDAVDTLLNGAGRVVRVRDVPDGVHATVEARTISGPRGARVAVITDAAGATGEVDIIELVLDETMLRNEMLTYMEQILGSALVIALIAGFLLFLVAQYTLVSPLRRLSANMTVFQEKPEDARRIIAPSGGHSEIARAERALATMQEELLTALNQRARLAALGEGMSKINHDLRNILASAQLISDRMTESSDPTVQRLSPRLLASIDRAVRLCRQTLEYGGAKDVILPQLKNIALQPIVAHVDTALHMPEESQVRIANTIRPDILLEADPDHVFRILFNLANNALGAILQSQKEGHISFSAFCENNNVVIEVRDDGPGIPEKIHDSLFAPFVSGAQGQGFGFGLPIARELAQMQGGTVRLVQTGSDGTVFEVTLPQKEESKKPEPQATPTLSVIEGKSSA